MFPDEPRITINGELLTDAEAMTVRVALTNFKFDLSDRLQNDRDNISLQICKGYLDSLGYIGVKLNKDRYE
jgi:hypothetical protein